MKLTVSARVTHEKYGLGVISDVDTEYTVIEFDEHGTKKFITRIVSLQPSDEPPPKRRRARAKSGTKKKATKKAAKTTKTTKAAKSTKKKAAKKKA